MQILLQLLVRCCKVMTLFFTIANPISLMWLPAVPSSAVLGVMNNTVTVAER